MGFDAIEDPFDAAASLTLGIAVTMAEQVMM